MGRVKEKELTDFFVSYFKEQPSKLFDFAKVIIGPNSKVKSEFDKLSEYQQNGVKVAGAGAGAVAMACYPIQSVMAIATVLGGILEKLIAGDKEVAIHTRKVQEKIIDSLNEQLKNPKLTTEERKTILDIIKEIEKHNETMEKWLKALIAGIVIGLLAMVKQCVVKI